MVEEQFGLFQGPENVKTRDAKITADEKLKRELADALKPISYDEIKARCSIVRGFISLYFRAEPAEFIKKPLQSLGGLTLEFCCMKHYDIAQGWMKEIRLHRDEKDWLTKHAEEKP